MAIQKILNMKLGGVLFKYLGVYISISCLSINQYQYLVDWVNTTTKTWNHLAISQANRQILINNTLLGIPTYLLSSHVIPETVLNKIFKITKDFLWGKGNNSSGFHPITISVTTLTMLRRAWMLKTLDILRLT